jgi:hypothetical protein
MANVLSTGIGKNFAHGTDLQYRNVRYRFCPEFLNDEANLVSSQLWTDQSETNRSNPEFLINEAKRTELVLDGVKN